MKGPHPSRGRARGPPPTERRAADGPSSRTYDVFLSYNSRDYQAVERVGRWLKDRGLTCFMDRWYLVPGTPWPVALSRPSTRAKAVAVFLGPGEMGRWQQREQHLALNRQTVAGIPVVPVLLPGSDPPLGFLSLNTWVDLRAGLDDELPLEVLAAAVRGLAPAEARGGGPGRRPHRLPVPRPAPLPRGGRPLLLRPAGLTRISSSRPSRVTRSWPSWGPPAAASRPWCGPASCPGCGPTRRRSGTSSPWCRRPDP